MAFTNITVWHLFFIMNFTVIEYVHSHYTDTKQKEIQFKMVVNLL